VRDERKEEITKPNVGTRPLGRNSYEKKAMGALDEVLRNGRAPKLD